MTPVSIEHIPRREIGRTGVRVTPLGFGGATIGRHLGSGADADAQAALQVSWDAGVRYFDTAPWYGRGLSELRVGAFLRNQPGDHFVLSTKVGRILRPGRDPLPPQVRTVANQAAGLQSEVIFDYGYSGIRRAFEDSLQRLGLSRIDLAIVHDLDLGYHAPVARWDAYVADLVRGGWRALQELRAAGTIAGIGFGINPLGMIPRFLDLFDDIDFFLLAGRYTLLEQDALEVELPACTDRGVSIVIGAVFNSGILATGPVSGAQYDYRDAPSHVLEKSGRILAVCNRYDVPPVAAALQFPLGHPAVVAVIPGPIRAEEARANAEAFARPIPAAFWRDLKADGLLRPDAPVPDESAIP
jgi:D-threo-aldose 1-dehydrogenase